jgi:DNA-binding IscR family transcriptional regulator
VLRITKQTDYGIVLLSRMAAEPERQFNAPELAVEVQLPSPTVSKILKLLARDGLLLSHRGVNSPARRSASRWPRSSPPWRGPSR